jgi:glutamate/tyrosine decarboxylase-like PLP-dependent enzyme
VGVSQQTIMGWESGRTRPRDGALRTWRTLRAKGVRELRAMATGGEQKARRAVRRIARLRVAVRQAKKK